MFALHLPNDSACHRVVHHALMVVVAAAALLTNCSRASTSANVTTAEPAGPSRGASGAPADTTLGDSADPASYEGVDRRGIPHYATAVMLSVEDAQVLRRVYGIEDPHRLYVSDSTEEGILKYDTQIKRCLSCYVNSYRVGFVSVRRPGESWEQAERRVRSTPAHAFLGDVHPSSRSTAYLDPDVRPIAERMLRDARAAGFRVDVAATYRSPLRQAFLLARGAGRTYTLTSSHSYGRALDVVVDDGNLRHPQTRRDWISFRRWVTRYPTQTGVSFRILGKVDRTWDWPHVELPSAQIGFGTIEEAVARARACLAPGSTWPCNFAPHLPAEFDNALVQ